jgi:ribosome-binding protein aMBF1 (putative translation factor)
MFEVRDGPGARRDGSGFAPEPEAERRVSGHRVREQRWIRAGSPADVMRVLTAARDRAELSNTQLARELGITHSQVTELIAGRKAPSVLVIVRWLGVCGWDLLAVER